MLSSGVESLLNSSVSAVIEELHTGLPESISTELMAVSEPNVALNAKSGVSAPVLAHNDSLSAEHCRTHGAEGFCQKTEDLDAVLKVISHGPAESLTEALLKAGDLEEDEKNRRNFRKPECSSGGYQKEDKGAPDPEECHAECCALKPGESWSKQEDPHLNQHAVKSSRTCCTEIVGSLKSTEENQTNVQVTAETLPKLTEEVQGMKADGTRKFSKAGYRNDRASKGLPPESNECPDVDTVMARAGVSETSMLDFLEPLKVTDVESATEHSQETNENNGLKAHTAMPLRTGHDVCSLETREEKLPKRNPELSTSLANCQTYQQDEESNSHNEPHKLSSVESCRTISTQSSEVLYSVQKSICYLDLRNMPLENNSTAVPGIHNETPRKHLPKNIKSQSLHSHGSGLVENQTSTSVPVEQISVIRSEGLFSARIDHREVSAVAQKSREPHCNECPPCTANEVPSRDKAPDNVCGKDSVDASGTTGEQVAETVLHKNKFKSSQSSKTLTLNMTSKIFQKDMKSSVGNTESVVTGLGNEHSDTWSCSNQSMEDQSTAASTSCVLSGNTHVDDVLPYSHSSNVEVDKSMEENDNLEGEVSAGYNSKMAIIFPEAHFLSACGSLPCKDDWDNRGLELHGINDVSTTKNLFCSAYTAEKPMAAFIRDEISNKNMEVVKQFDFCKVTDSSEIACDRDEAKEQISKYALQTDELDKIRTVDSPEAPEGDQRHASQTEKTTSPMENQYLACQSEFDGPIPGSKQHLESLKKQPNTDLQSMADSVEETKILIGCSPSEEMLFKTGDELPPLVHKYAREDSFQGTLKGNVVDLESLNGVRNEGCSGYVGFSSDLTEEKTIKLKEHKNACEGEDKGTLEDSKSHCSQHACFIKCAKGKAQVVFAGNEKQQSLPKMKCLVEDQEDAASAQPLPFSSIHKSLSCKPATINVFSETEKKKNQIIKSTLNNSCPQLTFELGQETDSQKGIGPSCFGKFVIQESFNKVQVDSEIPSAVNLGTSLPEEEKLCMLLENTQTGNCDLASVTKPLSVTKSIKRKASNTEIPPSANKTAASFLNGAKSSRICAHSKDSLRNEECSMLTVKDMDVTSQKGTHCGEKCKSTSVEEKMAREVAPRRKLPINSFLGGEDCLGTLLEDSKESGSKTVPLGTENYGKVLEEVPRSNLNILSKERKNDAKLTNFASASLLSETVCDYQAEDASDAETSPELQYNITPTFHPHMSTLSNSWKESPSNCVDCSELCVPYKLNAQNKDKVKEITEGQDTIPTRSVCKENKALGSERLDQTGKCQVHKRKKKREKMGGHLSHKAQQEQESKDQEKAKITLQPSMLHSSEHSSTNKLVTSRNGKFEGPSEETFAVRASENKLRSTLLEVKRPKITADIISSQVLRTQDSEMENLNFNLGYDGIPGAFGTTNKPRGPLPLKIQPGRTCKKVPTSYQLNTVRKSKKPKSSPFFETPLEIFPKQENTLPKSLCFPCKSPTMETETAMRFVHMPRQRAKRCSLLNSLNFRKCTKEPALLRKLSAMASKILAPAKSIHNLEPLSYSSEILPVGERCSQRRSKNLLEAFSCINRSLHSYWADSWCTKMFSFQPLALYPVESTEILYSDSSHKPPTSFLDTPVFPVSFHIKLDSSPVTDLAGITSQHSVLHRPVLGETAALPSEWTFSFLLSRSCSDTAAFKEDASLNDEELHSSLSATNPKAVALHPGRGKNALAERRGGYSMLGLHTVLALSSPGCYRIWTRRRNLTSHIPTIQRLFISQFAQGLKGARYRTSVSDELVSSLPYSLGRALSIWSQHGPSACPSEITPLHSNHCKWQPSVSIENSCAMLPYLPVQSVEALQTAGHEICLETSFPLPVLKPCSFPESSLSPSRLSASELQVHVLDEADASIPACLRSQGDTELKKPEAENRPKKVSEIRIRKTVPRPDPNLTPMGLPKPKRLKKKEFSLEEIYTNKNYKSPPPARSLETIFEEPKEKNGHMISVSQQKRKRILEFQDFTLPRKRRTRGKIKAVGSFTRAKKAALQTAELDALLSQKLMDLEAFFAKEAEQEQASST